MAKLVLDRLNKVYDNGFHAVHDLSLDVDDGEFLVLVGPSGCGKSTALRMIAGLESITSGTLMIGDRVVNDVHPKDRDIAMVFQNYALYPHMTVAENIAFALKLRRTPRAEIDERVQDAARMLELEEYLDRKPGQLSGGQRQRVAMGRAIVRRPSAFLMDEPLSNLDAKLRVQMRADIARLQRQLEVTTIYVTHDQVEAMTMGDRVAVLRRGLLQQVDAPQVLYDTPANLFVAAFIGSPAMNLLEATVVEGTGGDLGVVIGDRQVRLPEEVVAAHPGLKSRVGHDIAVGLRPENLNDLVDRPGHPEDQQLVGIVELREALGSDLMVHFSVPGRRVVTEDVKEADDAASEVDHSTDAGTAPLVARFTPHSRVRPAETVPIAVDVDHLHFFDLTSRAAIWS
jgi:multiple sugar transport system ATP-binding protein